MAVVGTVYFRGSRPQLRRLLADLPAIAGGRDADPTGAVRGLQLRVGMVALSLIKEAYVTKARGGTDAAGLFWPPLADSTIRRRRRGGQKSEILRDTGRLLNSLSPGVSGPSGSTDQVFEVRPGEVVVGTNVEYAKYHHDGTSRLPQRRLWPEPSSWPRAWWDQLAVAARTGLIRLVALLAGGSPP